MKLATEPEKLLKTHYPPNTKRAQRAKVNLVRYCDDVRRRQAV